MVPPGMGSNDPSSSDSAAGDNTHGQHHHPAENETNSIDDEIVTRGSPNQCSSPDPMELTEEQIFDTKLFPGRPDIFGESGEGSSRMIQRHVETPQAFNPVHNPRSLLSNPENAFPHMPNAAEPLHTGSPVFNSTDRNSFKPPYFAQVFGYGYSKIEGKQASNMLINYFQNNILDELLILNSDQWTPESAAIAVHYDECNDRTSLGIFHTHSRFEESISKLNYSVLTTKVIVFKNGLIWSIL